MKHAIVLILTIFFASVTSAMAESPPSAPSNLRSLTHTIGVPSTNTVIKVMWTPSTDPDGDLNGYGTKWDNYADTNMTAKTHEASATSAQSESLADGNWYFHIRAIDDQYNRSGTIHLGPFIIVSSAEPVKGDLNGDNNVNLSDAILGLQVCIGLNPEGINLKGDVNSDGKIGLEEVIYILRKISGIL